VEIEPTTLPCIPSSTRILAACTTSVVLLALPCSGLSRLSNVRNSTIGTVHSPLVISSVRSRARISSSAPRTKTVWANRTVWSSRGCPRGQIPVPKVPP